MKRRLYSISGIFFSGVRWVCGCGCVCLCVSVRSFVHPCPLGSLLLLCLISKVREVEYLKGKTSKKNPGAAGNGSSDSVVGLLPFESELRVS